MSIEEVHSIIGEQNLKHGTIFRYPGMSIDRAFDRQVEVLYLEDMRVCSIAVTPPSGAEYRSINLMRTAFGR